MLIWSWPLGQTAMADHRLDAARRVLVEYRARQDGTDTSVVRIPAEVSTEMLRALAQVTKTCARGVTLVGAGPWNADAYEQTLWREAARAGIGVSRVYVLAHRGLARNQLARQMALDAEAGVNTTVVTVSSLPSTVQDSGLASVWILDDQVVVQGLDARQMDAASEPVVVTDRIGDVRARLTLWAELWRSGTEADETDSRIELEEPLALSADLISGVAPVMCTADQVDPQGCSWYHGAWQYLRLLDMVSTPSWHSTFYLSALTESLRHARRVAITGTADYSMLAYVAQAAQAAQSETTEITVIDLCPTPLFACQWYAKRTGVRIRTIQSDILSASDDVGPNADLICTDALLTRFPKNRVADLVKAWRSMLRVGGELVTTVRIHARAQPARDAGRAIADFRQRAIERSRRWQGFIRPAPQQVGQLAETYARAMQSYDVGDDAEVKALLAEQGFDIQSADLADVPGELYPTVYLRVRARRGN